MVCQAGDSKSVAVIAHEHTRFVYCAKDDQVLLDERKSLEHTDEGEDDELKLSFDLVYDFAIHTPLDEIRFILDTARLNKKAAEESVKGQFGHAVSKTISGPIGKKYLGDSSYTHMLRLTAAACDARMDGAMIPVMSNSGSGNQGIAATLPVVSFAEDMKCSEEQLIRALMLSHLMVIYMKQSLGRLSALCGCVVAATGASCGITWLMGGTATQITYAIKNMIGKYHWYDL